MKKNLRNLLILFVVTLSAFSMNVSAEKITEKSTFSRVWRQEIDPANIKVKNTEDESYEKQYITWQYVFSSGGEDFAAYCQDPQRSATNNYTVDHILGTTKDKTENALELGILEIIKQGYHSNERTVSNDYVSTVIAIRAMALGLMGRGEGTIANEKYGELASANVSLAQKWYQNDISSVSFTGNYSWYNNKLILYPESDKILDDAQELFKVGIKAANEVLNGSGTATTIETSTSSDDGYQYQTIEYKNFTPGEAEMKNFQLSCPNCGSSGISIGSLEYRTNGGGWQSLGSGTNVLENISSGDGTVELRFSYTTPEDEENCNSANYKITFEYNDPNLKFIGAYLVDKSNPTAQRFYVIQENEDGVEAEIEGTIACGEACQTKISEPVCEGTAEGSVQAPTEIKKCIIQKNDDAGNTYQFTSGVDNKYCQVFCKEDYEKIKLEPVVKDVKCGSYFNLSSHIEGTKTCYTGGRTNDSATNGEKSIDKDRYIKDITAAQKMMIDGYDLWMKGKTALTTIESADCNGGCCCSGAVSWVTRGEYAGKDMETVDKAEGLYKAVDKEKPYSFQESCKSNCESKDNGDGTYSCTGSCTSGDRGALVRRLNDLVQNGLNMMDTGKENYEAAIKAYNSCTTAWKNVFLFQQKLEYYYDESRGENGDNKDYHPYYDLLIKEGGEELKYLEKDGAEQEEKSITVCTKTANEAYECQDGGKNVSGNADDSSPDEFFYNSAYGNVFEKREYAFCTTGGCKSDAKNISQASFVKKEVKKSQDYKTPTAFYQIAANGKITVNGSYAGQEIQIEALENNLPVSTSTVGGGVFKIKISGLGEFYDADNKVGRLMDVEGPNYDSSVGKVVKSQGGFDGDYACYYESPCRPESCPDCDFTCDGDECTWHPSCPDCDVICEDCIMNEGKINASVKTISSSNFGSAEREYGYNWVITGGGTSLDLLHQKAKNTIKEIEEVNEMVYDKTDGDDSQLAFSITLTPEMIKDIKKYNEEQQNNGGYINDSLTCKDVGDYKNLNCYSDFISELADKYGDKIIAPKRGTDDYWRLWDGYIYSENVIGGPSWK